MSGIATSASRVTGSHHEESQRLETATFGMWIFIASEMMFFGGLLFVYVYGRISFPAGFAAASRATDVVLGTVNTGLLLSSSFVVALAVAAGTHGRRKLLTPLLFTAAALGLAFLVVKGIEYQDDWNNGLFPGPAFHLTNLAIDGAPPGAELFYMLYFTMTAVHALHLAIGIAWLCLIAVGAHRAPAVWGAAPLLQVAGLYWHFVDIVWVFLYPLLYLVSRAS